MTELSGGSSPQKISSAANYFLEAPGLKGQVREIELEGDGTRSDGGLYEENVTNMLAGAEMVTQFVFEMEISDDLTPTPDDSKTRADGLTATTRTGEPALKCIMPSLGDNVGYAILYIDEAGGIRWIFPEADPTSAEVTRGGGDEIVFHLPRNSVPVPPEITEDEEKTRGPISKLGRRLVRVIAWATDGFVGQTALGIVEGWENKNRPYHFLFAQPGSFSQTVDWDLMRQGRTLLLIHGTASSAQGGFGQMASSDMEKLAHNYGKRIIAFNHPTLHCSPSQNVQMLLDMLPPEISLDLDIMTHSRGGLVGRELTERLAECNQGSRQLKINKALFVACPHQGTILANGDHDWNMIDRYTNLLTNLPDGPITLTLEAIMGLVKVLAHGTLKGLPGLQAMHPDGDYLKRLNKSPANKITYYALGANFTPTDPGLFARLGKAGANKFIDSVFGADNDGVVPTNGVYQAGHNSPGFPIPSERRVIYEDDIQIHHINFFGSSVVNEQIQQWLVG